MNTIETGSNTYEDYIEFFLEDLKEWIQKQDTIERVGGPYRNKLEVFGDGWHADLYVASGSNNLLWTIILVDEQKMASYKHAYDKELASIARWLIRHAADTSGS